MNTTKLLADFSSIIRMSTLKRLENVPDNCINWRLNNTAMSFANLIQHLLNIDKLFFSITTKNKRKFEWKLGTEEPHLQVDKPTYSLMLKKLKKFQLKRYSIISNLDKSALNKEIIDEKGKKITLWWFIMNKLIEHEIYHRGQISVYLKVLKGESAEINDEP